MQAKLDTNAASADVRNKALHPLQELKTRIASQTSIAQIFYLQDGRGSLMDDAIALTEAAAGKTLAPPHVATPGDASKPMQTGHSSVSASVVKTTCIIRAADLSTKTYLETEAEVEAYVSKLRSELLAAVHAGKMARVQ